jgi:hypothetical protein
VTGAARAHTRDTARTSVRADLPQPACESFRCGDPVPGFRHAVRVGAAPDRPTIPLDHLPAPDGRLDLVPLPDVALAGLAPRA